jgi:hypothetical protein
MTLSLARVPGHKKNFQRFTTSQDAQSPVSKVQVPQHCRSSHVKLTGVHSRVLDLHSQELYGSHIHLVYFLGVSHVIVVLL